LTSTFGTIAGGTSNVGTVTRATEGAVVVATVVGGAVVAGAAVVVGASVVAGLVA
jgi:hypothetical protein